MNEKERQKERKGFLYISDSETERNNKFILQARNIAFENKKQACVREKEKNPISTEQLLLCIQASLHGLEAPKSTKMCANPWNGWHGWLLQREKN